MFFPQFDLHIEIDEPFHYKQKELDINRETDIIEATNHKIERIKITDDFSFINEQVEKIIVEIKKLQVEDIKNNTFNPWDLEKEFNPDLQIKEGYLDIKNNLVFRTILDASNCLGPIIKVFNELGLKVKFMQIIIYGFPNFIKTLIGTTKWKRMEKL